MSTPPYRKGGAYRPVREPLAAYNAARQGTRRTESLHRGTSRQPSGIREAQKTSRELSSRCARLLIIIAHTIKLMAVTAIAPIPAAPCPAPKFEPIAAGAGGGPSVANAEFVAATINDSAKNNAIIFLITAPVRTPSRTSFLIACVLLTNSSASFNTLPGPLILAVIVAIVALGNCRSCRYCKRNEKSTDANRADNN
jgi:hypothetical protein